MAEALLEIRGLAKSYAGVVALGGVDLDVGAGETVARAGGSGSGKSTLARCVLRLIEADAGTIRFGGTDLRALNGAALRTIRPRIQMVFQDPMAAFNPRATVARILEDPLRLHGIVPPGERRRAVLALLDQVRLPAALAERRPHEISGGQRQRVAIARAMASRPALVVLDEPASALDVSVRAQVLNLLLDIQAQTGVGYLMISHDLAVVRAVASRVAVMHQGRIVESGDTDRVFAEPQSEVTRALIAAVPKLRRG